jgi:hypothetical protein
LCGVEGKPAFRAGLLPVEANLPSVRRFLPRVAPVARFVLELRELVLRDDVRDERPVLDLRCGM